LHGVVIPTSDCSPADLGKLKNQIIMVSSRL
jgi:hypothetical protein